MLGAKHIALAHIYALHTQTAYVSQADNLPETTFIRCCIYAMIQVQIAVATLVDLLLSRLGCSTCNKC